MPQPINYLANMRRPNFADSVMQGMQMGQQMRQMKQNRQTSQLQKQVEARNQEKWQMQKAAFAQEKIQQDLAKARSAEFNADLAALGPDSTQEDNELMYDKYPEFTKKIDSVVARLDNTNAENQKTMFYQAEHALSKGNSETAATLFENYGEAISRGKPQVAEFYKTLANDFRQSTDPEKSRKMLSSVGGRMIPDYHKSRQESATAKLTEAKSGVVEETSKTNLLKAKNETARLVTEAIKLKKASGGELNPKDKIDYELKFANQYLKEGGEYFERADRAYQNIVNASETGVGGLNMYLSFMKTIDPSSTVTGGEVTTAANAPGITSSFLQKWNKIFNSGSPSKSAIEQFTKEAKNIRDNAENYANRTKKRITNQVKGTNINPKFIFSEKRKEKDKFSDLGSVPQDDKVLNNTQSSSEVINRASSFLNKYPK